MADGLSWLSKLSLCATFYTAAVFAQESLVSHATMIH